MTTTQYIQKKSIEAFNYCTKPYITQDFIKDIHALTNDVITHSIAAIALGIIFGMNAGISTGIASAIIAYAVYKTYTASVDWLAFDPIKKRESLDFFNSLLNNASGQASKLPTDEANQKAATAIFNHYQRTQKPLTNKEMSETCKNASREFWCGARSFTNISNPLNGIKKTLSEQYDLDESAEKRLQAGTISFIALKILLMLAAPIAPLSMGQFVLIYGTSKLVPNSFKIRVQPPQQV